MSVTGIVDEVRQYDTNGRPIDRLDSRGYQWFNEYYPPSLDPTLRSKEGFLRRQLIPHLDFALNEDTPDLLEIKRNGTWQILDRFFHSGGVVGDSIAILVEGVRLVLYQSSDLIETASTNSQVSVRIDGIPQSPWIQSTDPTYVVANRCTGRSSY